MVGRDRTGSVCSIARFVGREGASGSTGRAASGIASAGGRNARESAIAGGIATRRSGGTEQADSQGTGREEGGVPQDGSRATCQTVARTSGRAAVAEASPSSGRLGRLDADREG